MLSMVVQVLAPKAAVTTRSVFMALPLSCFSAWIMAAWHVELTQTRGKCKLWATARAAAHRPPTKIDDDGTDVYRRVSMSWMHLNYERVAGRPPATPAGEL